MEEKRWESCNAEALLEEFFSQDNFRQLALSTGELIGCPLLVLDDTFHVAAHYLPLGFSDALFETAVRCGEITYEAGAIISKNAMLTAGWADYVQLADSPYRRRFAPLVSVGVSLGCLICVDTDGHLEQTPPHTWEMVEHITAKQLFMEVSRQDKPSETVEDILMHLLDGGFSAAAHFQLQASGTYPADFHPRAFALIDLETYHSAYMGKQHLKEELEAQIADSHPFLYKGDVFLFLHREGDGDIFSELAEEFQLKILISAPIDDLFTLPQLYRTAREALELMKDERFHGEAVCTAQQLRTPLLLKNLEGARRPDPDRAAPPCRPRPRKGHPVLRNALPLPHLLPLTEKDQRRALYPPQHRALPHPQIAGEFRDLAGGAVPARRPAAGRVAHFV